MALRCLGLRSLGYSFIAFRECLGFIGAGTVWWRFGDLFPSGLRMHLDFEFSWRDFGGLVRSLQRWRAYNGFLGPHPAHEIVQKAFEPCHVFPNTGGAGD